MPRMLAIAGLLLVILASFQPRHAVSGESAKGRYYYYHTDGKRYRLALNDQSLKGKSTWADDSDNPPMSARRAIRLADKVKEKLTKGAKTWKLEGAVLLPVVTDIGMGNKQWCWVVTYHGGGGTTGLGNSLGIGVAMDGSVIEPVLAREGEEGR